jgi:hypothetical protein
MENITIKEMVVREAEAELKRMASELQEELSRASGIEEVVMLQEELEEVLAALEDVIIHKDHYIKYGFIYQ